MAGELIRDFQRFSVEKHHEPANSVQHLNVDGHGKVQVGNTYIYNYYNESTTNQCLAALRASTDPRDEKIRIEMTKGGLLKGVYQWILDHPDFQRWREDDTVHLLWIEGSPGMGKTMLLCGIINELRKIQKSDPGSNQEAQPSLISFFFCQYTDHRLNGASAVLRGLIYLLILQQPSLLSCAQDKYDHAGGQAFEGERAFFTLSGILAEFLRNYSGDRCYLVIDALDECQEQLPLLLKFVTETSATCPSVKWIVSSRNIPTVKRELQLDQSTARISLEANNHYVLDAINKYIDYRTLELVPSPSEESLRNELRKQMRLKSGSTFLWVAIVAQELEKVPAFDFLDVLEEQPAGLEELYDAMMKRIKNLPRQKYVEFCRVILSTVFVTYRPLSLLELATISGLPASVCTRIESIKEIIDMCGSFVTILDDRVYLIHQSVKDYLTAKESPFIFNHGVQAVHLSLFRRSLDILQDILCRDIYNLGHPGATIASIVRPQNDPLLLAEYPCVHWINHLNDALLDIEISSIDEVEDGGLIQLFLEEHLLHWLEGLSLLKAVSSGGQAIVSLQKTLDRVKIEPMLTYMNDIRRLFQLYGNMLQERPLQAYASVLLFCPACSIVAQWFTTKVPEWIVAPKVVDEYWTANVAALEHWSKVVALFTPSPDGKIIASVCEKRVKIWDVASSQCFMSIGVDDKDVSILVFSPDSRFLAIGLTDATICIWDMTTYCSIATFSNSEEQILDIAFSEDSRRVASTFTCHKTFVWNIADSSCLELTRLKMVDNGQVISRLLHGSLNRVSISENGAVQIWNERGRTIKKIALGQNHPVSRNSVVFSQSGRFMVLWNPDWKAEDTMVQVWDLETSHCIGTFDIEKEIDAAALSMNGQRLGIVDLGTRTQVFDVATGCCLVTFKTGYDIIRALSFSYDSQQIITHNDIGALSILDIASGCLTATADNDERTEIMMLSHDGQQTATYSRGVTTIRGADEKFLRINNRRRVSHFVFSLNNQRLAIVYTSGVTEVWDTQEGICVDTFDGMDDWRGGVALTADGQRIAFTTGELTFNIEAIAPSSTKDSLKFAGNAPFAFSNNSQVIAAGYGKKQIKLWSITGDFLISFELAGTVCAVAFSRDGRHVATAFGSSPYTVNIWDASGPCLGTVDLPGFPSDIHAMFASPNSPLYINFEKGESRLRIARCTLDLEACRFGAWANGITTAIYSGYGLSEDNEWITYKGQNVLWLPPDYRPWTCKTAPSTIAIANQSQRLIVYRFADEGLSTPF